MAPESIQGKKQICRAQAALNPLLPRASLVSSDRPTLTSCYTGASREYSSRPAVKNFSVVIKTHFLSAHVISMWVELNSCEDCSSVYVLLNNDDNIYSHFSRHLLPGMEDSVIPVTINDFLSIGLPMYPAKPRWRGHWRNADYAFYYLLANKLLESSGQDDFVILIDADIGLCGKTWSDLLGGLEADNSDALLLSYRHSTPQWPHHKTVKLYYEDPRACIFGFTGLKKRVIQKLYKSRLSLNDKIARYAESLGYKLQGLSDSEAAEVSPISEGFVASEIAAAGYRVLDFSLLGKKYGKDAYPFWGHYNITTDKWGESLKNEKIKPGDWFIYHPLKEPCYGFSIIPS